MDAHAHLRGLGWRGSGYSLDSFDRGLKKPLLISRRFNERGLGAKTQRENQADQWWLNAFDSALKDLGSGKICVLQQVKEHGVKRGGLYSYFRQGESLVGTIPNSSDESTSTPPNEIIMALSKKARRKNSEKVTQEAGQGKKRKAEDELLDDGKDESPESTRAVLESLSSMPGAPYKVIDDIPIIPPDSYSKKKEKKVPARKLRKIEERKEQQRERLENLKAKAEAMKDPNFDWEQENKNKLEAQIIREVAAEIRKRELAEEFGPTMPSPAELLKMEKDADRAGPEKFHTTALAALSIKVHGLPKDGIYKKVKYKAEKIKRQKLIRDARRNLRAQLRHKYFGIPYVDETNMTEAEKQERRKAEKEERRQERRRGREFKAKLEEEQAKLAEGKEKARLAAVEAKKEQRKATQAAIAVMEADALLPLKEQRGDQFAAGADEIKLGLNIDGKVRTVPGIGEVDRYPNEGEKREKRLKAEAFEHGVSLEEWKAKLQSEHDEKQQDVQVAALKLREARGGLKAPQWRRYCILAEREGQTAAEEFFVQIVKENREQKAKEAGNVQDSAISQPADGVEPALAKPLNNKKIAKYAKKAEAKGISVEEYMARKDAKKARKGVDGKQESSEPEELVVTKELTVELSTNGETTRQAQNGGLNAPLAKIKTLKAHMAVDEDINDDGGGFGIDATGDTDIQSAFIIDTAGDENLEPAFMIDISGDPDILTRPKSTLVWTPDMLGDRQVKELSKVERKARRDYLAEKRRQRNQALGKNPMSRKERHKVRVEQKRKQRDRFVAETLSDKPREEVTKAELANARRQAKKKMKEIKKEKRNKMIHRKKLGEGLKGVYGGSLPKVQKA